VNPLSNDRRDACGLFHNVGLATEKQFSKMFCHVHWLAIAVATGVIDVFPYVKNYVETVRKLPSNLTCESVVKAFHFLISGSYV